MHNSEKNYLDNEIKVFPNRLPSKNTIETFLNEISDVDFITSVTLSGAPIQYKDSINVKQKTLLLELQVTWIYLEIDEINKAKVDKIEELCRKVFPYGFVTEIGRFTPTRETLTSNKGRAIIKFDYI